MVQSMYHLEVIAVKYNETVDALRSAVKGQAPRCEWSTVQINPDNGRAFSIVRMKVALGTYYKREE